MTDQPSQELFRYRIHSDIVPFAASLAYSEKIAFQDTYTSTLPRIQTFQKNETDAFITFIIPTIDRVTLMRTIQSLLQQTNSKWCAILVFDGRHPTQSDIKEIIENDKRFLYICINRHGSTDYPIHSAAGTVRNIAMNLVVTPWIGFVDDDDTIVPQYVDTLMEEISITPTVQAISFRMIVDNTIVPRLDCNTITDGQMGISFAIQSSLINDGFIFKQFDSEDFYFMNLIDRAQKKIVMSAYLIYYVNTSALDVSLTDATRTEIN